MTTPPVGQSCATCSYWLDSNVDPGNAGLCVWSAPNPAGEGLPSWITTKAADWCAHWDVIPGSSTPSSTFSDWTSTISANSGAINSYSVSDARFCQQGKLVTFVIRFNIISNGSAGGAVTFTLPVTAGAKAGEGVVHGRVDTGNKAVVGVITANATLCGVTFYDGTYPGSDNQFFTLGGQYESS